MGWLILLGALVFPPVFILWRPKTPARATLLRFRFAAAVVVVWMLTMLWSVQESAERGEGTGVRVEQRSTTNESSETWQADTSADTSLIVLLGWVPGLVYAGLLLLVRKAIQPPTVEVIEGRGRVDRGRAGRFLDRGAVRGESDHQGVVTQPLAFHRWMKRLGLAGIAPAVILRISPRVLRQISAISIRFAMFSKHKG